MQVMVLVHLMLLMGRAVVHFNLNLDVPFLNAFKPSAICTLSHEFATATLLLQGQQKTISSITIMAKDKLSPATAATVAQCWCLIHDLQNHALVANIEIHMECCMIMASHAAAFQWLHGIFNLAKFAPRESCWASRVIHILHDQILLVHAKKTSFSLNGWDYSLDFPSKKATVTIPHVIDDPQVFIAQAFTTVVQQWFGFPADQLAFHQAEFVALLC
jgi:hypothetical protein